MLMAVWEVDFYRRPVQDASGNALWELVVCDETGTFRYSAFCPQSEASAGWLVQHLQQLFDAGQPKPNCIQTFRPATLNLLQSAGETLGIPVQGSRATLAVKQYLAELAQQYPTLPGYTGQPYQPLDLDRPPPLPLTETLLGRQWRFAALPAAELVDAFTDRMIPVIQMPEALLPFKLGLASTTLIPGVVIDGGRRSLPLARWVEQVHPVSLNYIAGAPDGLILEAGLVDRWIIATFEDSEVTAAAAEYERRKQISQGLHFLLVQPDNSGMTYTGFWLLKNNFERDFDSG
jgi:hypothetical protein